MGSCIATATLERRGGGCHHSAAFQPLDYNATAEICVAPQRSDISRFKNVPQTTLPTRLHATARFGNRNTATPSLLHVAATWRRPFAWPSTPPSGLQSGEQPATSSRTPPATSIRLKAFGFTNEQSVFKLQIDASLTLAQWRTDVGRSFVWQWWVHCHVSLVSRVGLLGGLEQCNLSSRVHCRVTWPFGTWQVATHVIEIKCD